MFDCNDTITIWNRVKNNNSETWHRLVIPVLCKYKTKITRSVSSTANGQSVDLSNSQTVIIPMNDIKAVRAYIIPEKWHNITDNERAGKFTVQENDMIALGEHMTEITGIQPYRLSDLQNGIRNCFIIKSIKDNTRSRMGKHFKIEGV